MSNVTVNVFGSTYHVHKLCACVHAHIQLDSRMHTDIETHRHRHTHTRMHTHTHACTHNITKCNVPGVYNPPVHKQHMMSEKPWSIMSPLLHTKPHQCDHVSSTLGEVPGV